VSELFNVFLKNNLHECSPGSSYLRLWRFRACSRRNCRGCNCSWRCRCSVHGCSWYNDARGLRARSAARERQQSDVAGALDGHTQPALVPRAHSRHAPRENFPALLHELRQDVRALVVDEVHLLDAEFANFLFAEILALATRPATWAAGPTTARAAFAARTTVAPTGPMTAAMAAGAAFTPRHSTGRCC